MYTINKIEAKATFPVRHPVLRAGKPLSSCYFEGDEDVSTLHFGVFEYATLLGVASFFAKKCTQFYQENQFQLRGMAILEKHQNKGLGRILLQNCESHFQEHGAKLIWFNARESAIGFYESLGYTTYGELFDIPDVGPHVIMYKNF
jgi:GNAT superfamily N-acetyltransferase